MIRYCIVPFRHDVVPLFQCMSMMTVIPKKNKGNIELQLNKIDAFI